MTAPVKAEPWRMQLQRTARKLDESSLVENARLAGATPLWEWIGDGATVFSY